MTDPAVWFVVVWVALAVIMTAGIIALLVWAARSRQFRDQDRAARLPLESGIPAVNVAAGGPRSVVAADATERVPPGKTDAGKEGGHEPGRT
jgi:cbb3-type cytochrome oxidase maturation protein